MEFQPNETIDRLPIESGDLFQRLAREIRSDGVEQGYLSGREMGMRPADSSVRVQPRTPSWNRS